MLLPWRTKPEFSIMYRNDANGAMGDLATRSCRRKERNEQIKKSNGVITIPVCGETEPPQSL